MKTCPFVDVSNAFAVNLTNHNIFCDMMIIYSPGSVTGGCQDLSVTKETAARQVTWVGR